MEKMSMDGGDECGWMIWVWKKIKRMVWIKETCEDEIDECEWKRWVYKETYIGRERHNWFSLVVMKTHNSIAHKLQST